MVPQIKLALCPPKSSWGRGRRRSVNRQGASRSVLPELPAGHKADQWQGVPTGKNNDKVGKRGFEEEELEMPLKAGRIWNSQDRIGNAQEVTDADIKETSEAGSGGVCL